MAKKKTSAPKVKAEAAAKAELVAKATYQRKHFITEVIPTDVTRAKAGAWLDLISPITEWAGLRGDALKFKRGLLRIQQEAALDKLGLEIEKKMRGHEIMHPVTPKILVPSLEAVSLEDPDSPLIDWWANLLVAATTKGEIRPFLIDLMSKIGPQEAAVLDEIWSAFLKSHYGAGSGWSAVFYSRSSLVHDISARMNKVYSLCYGPKIGDRKSLDELSNRIGEELHAISVWGDSIGVPCEMSAPLHTEKGDIFRSQRSPLRVKAGAAIDVVQSLNVMRENVQSEPIDGLIGFGAHYDIRMLEFTELGFEFMKACRKEVSD